MVCLVVYCQLEGAIDTTRAVYDRFDEYSGTVLKA